MMCVHLYAMNVSYLTEGTRGYSLCILHCSQANESKEECQRQSLEELLITPIQRIPRIILLLQGTGNSDSMQLTDSIFSILYKIYQKFATIFKSVYVLIPVDFINLVSKGKSNSNQLCALLPIQFHFMNTFKS